MMNVQRIAFGVFLLVVSVFVSIAGVYSVAFINRFQNILKNLLGFTFSFDERQLKMMGYILPIGFILLGLAVMAGSLYMIYEAIYFGG